MFPPEKLSDGAFEPLNEAEFIQRVLLPETGLQLIKEDRECGDVEALRTMRDSAIYGMSMFPDLGEKDEVRTAIVEDRARKRRKEIEREESGHFDLDGDSEERWDAEKVIPPTSSFTETSTGSSPLSAKRRKWVHIEFHLCVEIYRPSEAASR